MTQKTSFTLLVITILSLSLFTSCEEESATIKDYGKEYLPMYVGSYHIYKLDSMVYDGINQKIDTTSLIIKDVVTDILLDSLDVKRYRIERSYLFETNTWLPFYAYSISVSNGSIQSFENNDREIRLSFPVHSEKLWDGYLYSDNENQQYAYQDILEPFVVGDSVYSETITVLQKELIVLNPPIVNCYRKEVFAKNVGMVYKVDRDLDLQDGSGREIIYELIEYK